MALTDCLRRLKFSAEDAGDVREFARKAGGNEIQGVKDYIESLQDDLADLRQQLADKGFDLSERKIGEAGNSPDVSDQKPTPEVDKPKKPEKAPEPEIKDVGERLDGARKHAFENLSKEMKDAAEGEAKAKLLLSATSRSLLFPINLDAEASNGTRAYLERVRGNLTTFLERADAITGGGRGKWSTPSKEAVIKAFTVETDSNVEKRLRLTNLAADYIAMLTELENLTKHALTIEEAESALTGAIFTHFPSSVEEWKVERKKPHGSNAKTNSQIFLMTEFGEKFQSATGHDHPWRRFEPDGMSTFRYGLQDDMTVAEGDRAKPLRRPGVSEIVREGRKDYRKGKNVSPEDFMKTFGFRGVQFGNWLTQADGILSINQAFDALHDLADTLGIDPKNIALSKNGVRMGISFGARGSGSASAHYEPTEHVINLTKTRGDGTVAHEWMHALDFALRANPNQQMTLRYTSLVGEIKWALQNKYDAVSALRQLDNLLMGRSFISGKKRVGPIETGSRFIQYLWYQKGWGGTSKTTFLREAEELGAYWSDPVELWARAGEAAVFDMIQGSSPYLVTNWVADSYVTKTAGYRGTPYPSGDERAALNGVFGNFLAAVRFDKDGNPTIDEGYAGPQKDAKAQVQALLDDIGKDLPGRRDKLMGRKSKDDVFAPSAEDIAARYGKPGSLNREGLGIAFAAYLTDPANKFSRITEAQKMAEGLVGKAISDPRDLKVLEEAIELGSVIAARRIFESMSNDGASNQAIFGAMVDLYQRQPPLLTRTSTSAANQAYSTPVPIAFLADHLAGIGPETLVYEPTAGQGVLAMTATAQNVQANEKDPDRAKTLELQGFNVSTDDATTYEAMPVDVVIANPPFGNVKDAAGNIVTFQTEKFPTNAIDHVISLKALESMKDDGRAVLIIAGQKHLGNDPDGARKKDLYNTAKNRAFFKYLYDTYGVSDHFTIDGNLYKRQGAAWPIDIIVIAGRGKSSLKLPGVNVPRVYDSFEGMKELLNGTSQGAEERELDEAAIGLGADKSGSGIGWGDAPAGDNADGAGVDERPDQQAPGLDQSGQQRPGNDTGGTGLGEPADLSGTEVELGGPPVSDGGGNQGNALPNGSSVAGGSQNQQQGGGANSVGNDAGSLAELDQHLSDLENFDDIFDSALESGGAAADLAAPPAPTPAPTPGKGPLDAAEQAPKPAAVAAKDAATNTLKGLDEAMSGLTALFGADPTRLTSGIGFDPETYAKAKPFFMQALAHFKQAVINVKEMVSAFVKYGRDTAKWTDEFIGKMKPYLKQFITDALNGEIPGFGTPKTRKENTETETKFQTHYDSSSEADPVGTLVPANMRSAVIEALQSHKDRHGDIDAYVAERLGMSVSQIKGKNDPRGAFSAEQVDALGLAIDNVENGKGFIIGDQTGVGKGRFVAGMIKYALHNNITPIFVTKDAKLYGDMFRDTADIGLEGFSPLMTNNGITVSLEDGSTVRSYSAGKNDEVFNKVAETGVMPGNHNVLMTTYSQLQTIKGRKDARHLAVEALAKNSLIILDEAHEAGGTEGGYAKTDANGNKIVPRSEYIRSILAESRGVVYSSATYAKNPHVMTLYFKTDMADAVDNIKDLTETIKRGGVPLQQVVANMLVRAGQYLRRERSFDGVKFGTKTAEVDLTSYATMAGRLRDIFELDMHMVGVREAYGEMLSAEGQALSGDNAVGDAGVTSATFSSMMHNVISQSLLSLKADAAAQEAIDQWKAGKKPIIALSGTLGAFLDEHIEEHNLKTGEKVEGFNFNALYNRYLARTRTVSIKDAYDKTKSKKHYITDAEMQDMGFGELVDRFDFLKDVIEGSDMSAAPPSPIDHMLEKMRAAGMKVDEITGRQSRLVTTKGMQKLGTRQATIAEKGRIVNDYNSGKLDGLVINKSGSTGLSLHASVKYLDKKTRHMILMQADANIDVFMQMLGRIHRTGQVVPPEYTMLMANVAAERRPAAITAGKMKSLNANTSANSDSAFTDAEAVDFLNRYGDMVVAEILAEDADLARILDVNPKETDDTQEGSNPNDGLARKVTGRLSILDPALQTEVFDKITADYNALIARLDQLGENTLVAKTRDLKAKTIQKLVLEPAKSTNTGSPFTEAAYLEKLEVERLGKPYSLDAVQKMVQEALAGKPAYQWSEGRVEQNNALFESAATPMVERESALKEELVKLENQRMELSRGANEDELKAIEKKFTPLLFSANEKYERARQAFVKATVEREAVNNILNGYPPGRAVSVKIGGGEEAVNFMGVVLSHDYQARAKNPLALSNSTMTIAVADAVREINVPYTQIVNGKYEIDQTDAGTVRDRFARRETSGRETRYMITGNLLSGYNAFRKGQMTIFTDSDGNVRDGILMSPSFDPAKEIDKKGVALPTPENVISYLQRTPVARGVVMSNDGIIMLTRDSNSDYVFKVKPKGGRGYITDKALTKILGDFVQRGGKGNYTVSISSPDKLRQALTLLQTNGVTWKTDQFKDIAKKVTGQTDLQEVAVETQAQRDAKKAENSQANINSTGPMGLAPNFMGTPKVSESRRGPAPLATDSPAFKAWFGESKVVDEGGHPLVMYHGTAEDIQEFDPNHPNKKDPGWMGRGLYFSSNAGTATAYSSLKGGRSGANVMPVYLKLENPYRMSLEEKQRKVMMSRERQAEEADKFRDWLIANGHDGVILEYGPEQVGEANAGIEVMVLSPTQIKSAFNDGSYDRDDANISSAQRGPGGNAPIAAAELRPMLRGTDAISRRMGMQVNMDASKNRAASRRGGKTVHALTPEEVREVDDFKTWVGEHMLRDVGLRIREVSGPQGRFNFGDGVVEIFRNAIASGNFSRTMVHELWHSLSRSLSMEDRAAVYQEYRRQRETYLKANPWARPFLSADGTQIRATLTGEDARLWDAKVSSGVLTVPDGAVTVTREKGQTVVRMNWSDENYRYKDVDEYFAETMADKYFDMRQIQEAKARGVLGHARALFRRMVSGLKRVFGRDATGRIFDGFSRQEYEATNQGPIGNATIAEARRSPVTLDDPAKEARLKAAMGGYDGLRTVTWIDPKMVATSSKKVTLEISEHAAYFAKEPS